MSAFIREGDTTDHGGTVLNCSPDHKVDGKNIARLGDMVSCPKCDGVYPIVQILPRGMTMSGKPPAFEGDRTACGASLIASQSIATAQPATGTGGQTGLFANHQTTNDGSGPYRGRFQVLDESTSEPIPDHPYALYASNGATVSGRTDASGYTQWYEADEPVSLRFSSPPTQVRGGASDE